MPEVGVPAEERLELLGEEALAKEDVAYTTLGGPDGVAVLRADAVDGFAWKAIADLPTPPVDTDLWVANSCLDPFGEHMAVVYAPRAFANDEANFLGGAWGAVVDLASGNVTDLGRGHSMAYFNPGCGAGSFAAFLRYTADGATQVGSVDMTSGKAAFKVDVEGQVTSPATMADGAVIAVTERGIQRVDGAGLGSVVARPKGRAFGLQVDATGRLGYLNLESPEQASLRMIDLAAASGREQTLGAGPLTSIGLKRSGETLYVFGEAEIPKEDHRGVEYVKQAAPHAQVSLQGSLIINSVAPAGMGEPGSATEEAVLPQIEGWVPGTRKKLEFFVDPLSDASKATSSKDELTVTVESEPSAAPAMLDVRPLSVAGSLRAGSPTNPIEDDRTCAVPRNDPQNQAYQPKPRQVQWAVDRAVSGELTELRGANFRNWDLPAYSPQGMFPRVTLTGGGTIPPQIVLGILAQESNLWQASRYTAPGSTGNPLIGDFYGSRPEDYEGDEALWDIDFSDADCGYGVGQITDGMRLAGRERPGEVALSYNRQRAIALDYAANVAMAVRMLSQKWNEVKAAGMDVNNGSSARVENWFFAVWAYNSGFYPNDGGPWGVGWFNNPINPIYPPNRDAFLDGSPSDAAKPQLWPYPEKVLGFAAHSLDLPQTVMADKTTRTYPTNYVSAFTTAWWPGDDDIDADENRRQVKPPIALFCSMNVNQCDPNAGFPCTLPGEPECWWHADAIWKSDCESTCGRGEERFDGSYSTEASAMGSHLPEITRQLSFPPNCQPAPTGVIVIDNVQTQPVREGCARQGTAGSFQLQFESPDANGSYSAKVDLHQQGGGYNAHFYWSHMRTSPDPVNNVNNRLKITGRWSLGQSLNQWTRVWIHLPDHAAWSEQAAYNVELGNGQSRTRHLPQRRYENSWVPIGVFPMNGVPAVSLSNLATIAPGVDVDDVAWDAVGFEPLASKPADFVVALGDSFSSGEGAGDYSAWSDHDGEDDAFRNSCHQSRGAWIEKTVLPGNSTSIGTRDDARDASLDFHLLACSGAESENLLPFETVTDGQFPENGEGELGEGQFGLVSQLDAGYLDENTTLVTLSIGGNDMRFAPIISKCAKPISTDCRNDVLDGDSAGIHTSSMLRLAYELPSTLSVVLEAIQTRAPNATIALVGYPRLFDIDTSCVMIGSINQGWLNEIADQLAVVMQSAADAADSSAQRVVFVNPQTTFQGHTLCSSLIPPFQTSGLNGLVTSFTPGDKPFDIGGNYVSQQSVHPNDFGTGLYSDAVEAALQGVY